MKTTHEHSHGHVCSGGHAHGSSFTHIHTGSACCSACGTEAAAPAVSQREGTSSDHHEDSGDGDSSDLPDRPKPISKGSTPPAGKNHCQLSHNDSDNCCGEDEDESSCSCCSAISFDESEEGELEEQNHFRQEIFLLGSIGAVFALLLIFENQIENIVGAYTVCAAFIALYLICGVPVLKMALRAARKLDFFNEFTLMSTATIAAIGIGEMSEAVGVMLFYRLGEAFQEKAASQSRHSIKSLLAQKPMFARIVRGGEEINSAPKDVRKGDLIKVLPGEMIPIDGVIKNGAALIDSSAITGESVPVAASAGTNVYGGTLSLDGMLLIEASGPFEDSTIARILEMVQGAVERKSPTERFIARFAKWYTPAVFAIATLIAFVPPLAGYGAFSDWLYRGLVLLVISCPCALVISIPLGYFGGIGAASNRGILVKGASVFDSLSKISIAVFDKTGTLTRGVFEVASIVPSNGVTKEELLGTAALAEAGSNHPIARSIERAAAIKISQPQDARLTQLAGKGIIYEAGGTVIAVGNSLLMSDFGADAPEVFESGTVVYILKNNKYLGYITVSDQVREESCGAITELRKLGVNSVYMLTGDRGDAASRVARELGLDDFRAELLPEDKVSALKDLSGNETERTIFIGDGANDGPVLVSAGIGVAMGGLGSQVAVEVADAVILDDSPSKVAELFKIGEKTRAIVWQNVSLALGVKGVFIVLGAMGVASLWEAVFADVGVALLAVLNSTRAAKIS